jgi:hypothetical protein
VGKLAVRTAFAALSPSAPPCGQVAVERLVYTAAAVLRDFSSADADDTKEPR